MTTKSIKKIEREIATAFVNSALAAGCAVSVGRDGEAYTNLGDILGAMFTCDDDTLYIVSREGIRKGWALLVYGNGGWDVVADYSPNVQALMVEANRLSDKYSN